jgi:hypothetical protein
VCVKDVPAGYDVIHKVQKVILENKKKELGGLKKCLDRKRFRGCGLSKRIYAAALVVAPGLSFYAAETFIPLVIAAFIADSDPHSLENFANLTTSFPSATALSECIMSYAVDCIIEVSLELEKAEYVFLTCDKGNKKGVGHFVKVLSWWDEILNRVRTFTLDIDASKGSSSACAEAIDHSLQKLIAVLLLAGQSTDSGGGGVLEDLAKYLAEQKVTQKIYWVASCTLHAIQLALSNPVKRAFKEGKLGTRSMMQMLHTVYDLQESMEKEHFSMYLKQARIWVAENCNATGIPVPELEDFENDWLLMLK